MDTGWIKLHRKILEWEWLAIPEMVSLYLYLLLTANHEEKEWQGQKIYRGQTIIGRKQLNQKLGISERKIRTCLTRLKTTNEIAIKTTNRYSIITIIKYNDYQIKDEKRPAKRPAERQTNDQQTTTPKELKNNKNIIQDEQSSSEIPELIKLFEAINPASKRFYGNITQRKACEDLIETYTFERVKNVIENTLPKTNKIKFMPNIRSPLQLYEKWSQLEDEIFKLKNKGQIIKNKVAFH